MNTRFDIQRVFGPVDAIDASAVADDLINDAKFVKLLNALAAGDIEPREFAYAVQIMMESADKLRNGGYEEHGS
jgi:hypothetical protein